MEILIDSLFMLVVYIASNLVALFMVMSSWKWPAIGRVLYILLFGYACWLNATTSLSTPEVYLTYANYTFLPGYKSFILGFFSEYTTQLVFAIAICQGLIAVSLFMRGVVFKIGAVGAIVFLLAIAPLGVGSAFPATLVMAARLWILLRKGSAQYFLWQTVNQKNSQKESARQACWFKVKVIF